MAGMILEAMIMFGDQCKTTRVYIQALLSLLYICKTIVRGTTPYYKLL